MTSIAWTWGEFWAWYEQIEEFERRTMVLRELAKDRWIHGLSVDSQFKVFKDAPMELKMQMRKFPDMFKREMILMLQMEEDKKFRKFNRGKRRF